MRRRKERAEGRWDEETSASRPLAQDPEDIPEPEDQGPPEGEEETEEAKTERETANKAQRSEWLQKRAEYAKAVAIVTQWKLDSARRERKAARIAAEEAEAKLKEAQKVAAREVRLLEEVKKAIGTVGDRALVDLRTLTKAPAQTFQVLRAAVRVLGKEELAASWTGFLKGLR